MIQPSRHTDAPGAPERDRSIDFYGLIGLVLLGLMFWGARSLWDSSESRYGQVAFEMLTSGNWLVPTLAGEPHLTKPPFTYWMAAAGMKLFGVNAWGARFFLALFFTGTLFCVRELAIVMGYGRKAALGAAFIFATAVVPFIGGHTLTTDGFLTFWETLGILAAWKVWQGPAQRSAWWRLVFWAAFGMGFFTKGPPALLPLVAIAAFVWLRRGQGRGAALVSLPGIGLFLGLSLWWFIALVARDPELLQYFLGDEVIGRIASTMHERNAPFWIYAPVILFGVGPWVVLWPRLAARIYRRFRQKTLLADGRHLFLLLWFTLPLFFFVPAKSRMPLYVMPLFVPLALAMAAVWNADLVPRLERSPVTRRAAVLGLAVWILALASFTVWPDHFPGARSQRPVARAFDTALARIEAPTQLYWVSAGHQKYSIPFYMQAVVGNAERFDRHLKDHSTVDAAGTPRVLYITKTAILDNVLQNVKNPPDIISKTPRYALIEWPRTDTSREERPPVYHTGVKTSGGFEEQRPGFHNMHRGGFYAVLLLMLANSRH